MQKLPSPPIDMEILALVVSQFQWTSKQTKEHNNKVLHHHHLSFLMEEKPPAHNA